MKKTRNFKKLMSSVLALVMVLSTMMLVPLTIGAEGLQGDGSEVTPYLVGSKADLEAVKAAITADDYGTAVYVKLTADIDMASAAFSLVDDAAPVAPDATADPAVVGNAGSIKWQIDGAGYTISNTAAPLLVSSLGGIVIKNLNVVTAQDVATGDAAGLVALLKGTATIENCTVSGTIKATAGNAAGFVAVMDSGKETGIVTFTDCKNDADVTASAYAAGFVAKVATGEPTINGALNTGDINSTTPAGLKSSNNGAAAGFIGWVIDKKCDLATVKNAINLGKITATNNVNAAFVGFSKTGYIALENCFDNGNVVRNSFGSSNTIELAVNNTATYEETLALIQAPKTAAAKLDKTANAWDGILVEEPALQNPAADNSAENPYLVGKASELAFFSYHADNIMDTNYWIKLTADINLGGKAWQGMVTARTEQLTVVVDGDGYTIYNGTMNTYLYGFFVGEDVGKAVQANLTVKNLHFAHMYGVGSLDSVKNETSASTAGMIAGAVTGDAVVSITNVTVDASCVLKTTASSQKSGALIGGVEGNATVTIDKCAVSATLLGGASSTAYAGDLTGTLCHGGFIGATTRPVTITNSITEVNRCQYETDDGTFGMILGIATVTGSTFTNVFASGSSLANSSCRYFDGKDRSGALGQFRIKITGLCLTSAKQKLSAI